MTEADYLGFVAKNISRGLYQKGGYYVLPYPVPGNSQVIYFPDLGYIPKFWRDIASCPSTNLGDKFPFPFDCVPTPGCKNGDILNTQYGSAGSFYVKKLKKGYKIIMTQRVDMPKTNLEHTQTLAKLKISQRLTGEIGEIDWHKRQAIASYLNPVKNSIVSPKIIVDSTAYLAKLGFSNIQVIDTNTFTVQELALWNYLLGHKNEVVSFDDAGDAVWPQNSDEKFSLYSLAKLVQSIRGKLRAQNIQTNMLQTIRKRGYMIVEL